MKNIYISSTYKDLFDYREAISVMFGSKALDDYHLIKMEGYVAENNKRAINVCLKDVAKADIYILILAKSYGSIVDGTNKSYTEMEYDAAVRERNKRGNSNYAIFVYYSTDDFEKRDFADSPGLSNLELSAFYAKVKKENACFTQPFYSKESLCNQILLTLMYNFEKPSSEDDFSKALLLLDRAYQTEIFSEYYANKLNCYHFSAIYSNGPNSFISRIHQNELDEEFEKCIITLAQLAASEQEKFNRAFRSFLPSALKSGGHFRFDFNDKIFIGLEISDREISKNQIKLQLLHNQLLDFLPGFLNNDSQQSADRIFCIYYIFKIENPDLRKRFDVFVSDLNAALKIYGLQLQDLPELENIEKNDISSWFSTFYKNHFIDEYKLDAILECKDDPFKSYPMSEARDLINNFIIKKSNV